MTCRLHAVVYALIFVGLAGCGEDEAARDAGADAVAEVDGAGETSASDVSASDVSASDSSSASDTTEDTVSPPSAWIMGYYAGYARDDYPVAAIDWDSLTHIAVAFYLPDNSGTLDERLYIDEVGGPALAREIIAAAHAHGKKALASIGGAAMHGFWVSSASEDNRATFVANLVDIVARYGYDGLDLDWEPILPADTGDVLALVSELRAALPDAILTMPVGFENANLPSDLSLYAQLSNSLDQINAMTYGMAGDYPGWRSWHSSALYQSDSATPTSVDVTVNAYLAAGVPAEKLGVGAGFYGLCYSPPVTGPLQRLGTSTVIADDYELTWTNIVTTYDIDGAGNWDALAHAPYLSFETASAPLGCSYISYEDEQSLTDKAAYIVARKLGGIIIWTINQGYLPAAPTGVRNPLLRALRKALP